MFTIQLSDTVTAKFADRIRDGRKVTKLEFVPESITPLQGMLNNIPVCWYITGQFFKERKSDFDLVRLNEEVQ